MMNPGDILICVSSIYAFIADWSGKHGCVGGACMHGRRARPKTRAIDEKEPI